MTFMYLTFGEKPEYHVQAYLSMLSFRRQTSTTDRIVMVTTAPQFYRNTAGWVETVGITDEQVKEWQGEYQFFWRAKIKAIEMVGQRYPDEPLLYLDCDTVLRGSIDWIKQQLSEGHGLMDTNDGHPSRMKTKSLRMWKTVAGHTYGGITLGMQHNMYCAGVVGIPGGRIGEVTSTALALCDGMLADKAERIVIEQYALSIALYERVGVLETSRVIAHYWAVKDLWIAAAHQLMTRAFMVNATLEEELRMFDETDWSQLPVYVHRSNTARRIGKLVAKLFPDRDYRYLRKDYKNSCG